MTLKEKLFYLLTSKEKKFFFLIFFLMVIASILEAISIALVIPSVSLLIDPLYVNKINFFLNNYNFFFIKYIENYILEFFIGFVLFIFLFKFIYMNFLIYFKLNYVSKVSTRLSYNLFSNYLNKPYGFHLNQTSSKLITNITNEVQSFAANILSPVLEILIEFIIILGLLILLIVVEPLGSLILFVSSIITGSLYHYFTYVRTKSWGEERRVNEIFGLKLIRSGLSGIKEVIIYSKKNYFVSEYFKRISKLYRVLKKQQFLVDTSKYYIELVAIFVVFILILILLQNEKINPVLVKMSLFAVVFFKILPALNRILSAKQRVTFALVSVENIYQDIKPSFNHNNTKSINNDTMKKKLFFKNHIKLENISFHYNKNNPILKNLNLVINKGEIIGIIGPSGSGKSTTINILTGLLKPKNGKILVDKIHLNNDFQIDQLQKKISYIPQNFFMLDDTIRSNILFEPNSIDKTYDKKIYESLSNAQLLKFVKSLPNKLDTIIGERGSKISVGQAQRLSIARALFREPDILILDEATSALDEENEKNFLKIIAQLKNKITIVIISHKPSALKFCDNIYKLKTYKLLKIKK